MQGDMIKKNDPECCPVLINKNDTQDLGKCEDAAPDTIKKCEGGIPNIRFRGFMGEWEQRKLEELLEKYEDPVETPHDGYERVGIRSHAKGTFHSFVEPGKELDTAKMHRVAADKFILNITFAWEHAVAITDESDAGKLVSHRFPQFSFNKKLKSHFFKYLMLDKKFKEYLELSSPGGAGRNRVLKISDMLKYEIKLPSVQEQIKIGEYFDSLDNLITLHQRKCDETRELKKYMLQKMFPKDGKKVPEIRFKGFTGEWEQRKVREVADRYDNLRIPVAANLRIPGSTPYYGANGIQDYVEGYTHEGEFVLVAEDGANDLKNYPVKCVKGRIWVNNHAHVLQGKNEITDNRFLAFAISQADIESLLVGGGRAKLNAETLMGLDLLLPVKQEQVLIGNYFANLDRLVTFYQRKCGELKELKQYMLRNMFPQKI